MPLTTLILFSTPLLYALPAQTALSSTSLKVSLLFRNKYRREKHVIFLFVFYKMKYMFTFKK